jgi:hypothetical protein
MIARLCTRHAMLGLVALAMTALAMTGLAKPAAAADPSPTSILIAKQIIQIKGVSGMFDPLVRGVVEKVKDQFMQTNFMWAKDLNEVAANMHEEYDSRSAELVDVAARIYASHFTEAELKDMLVFYKSPLGQKMIVEEPKALDESLSSAGQWGDTLAAEVIGKMRIEMKKRGHDL